VALDDERLLEWLQKLGAHQLGGLLPGHTADLHGADGHTVGDHVAGRVVVGVDAHRPAGHENEGDDAQDKDCRAG